MRTARIYQPSKTAMQSGRAKTQSWILEYDTASDKKPDPLMGWAQGTDTLNQVRMKFSTLEDAQKYAEENGLYATVQIPAFRKLKPRNYGDNFKYIPPEEG